MLTGRCVHLMRRLGMCCANMGAVLAVRIRLATTGSRVSIFDLLLILVVLAVSFWGASRIVLRMGYSSKWLLAPFVSLVLTFIGYIKLYVDLHSLASPIPFNFGITTIISGVMGVGVVWTIDKFTILANWLLFLIVAFAPWPAGLTGESVRRTSDLPAPPTSAPQPGRSVPSPFRGPGGPPTPASDGAGSPLNENAPQGAPAASVAPTTGAGSVRIKHCVWCGESLPGSRALFHDCGSKDRPATNCAACGSALPSDGAACTVCASGQ